MWLLNKIISFTVYFSNIRSGVAKGFGSRQVYLGVSFFFFFSALSVGMMTHPAQCFSEAGRKQTACNLFTNLFVISILCPFSYPKLPDWNLMTGNSFLSQICYHLCSMSFTLHPLLTFHLSINLIVSIALGIINILSASSICYPGLPCLWKLVKAWGPPETNSVKEPTLSFHLVWAGDKVGPHSSSVPPEFFRWCEIFLTLLVGKWHLSRSKLLA